MLHKSPEWWVKISDFGISKRTEFTVLRTRIGTDAYLAPEVKGIYSPDLGEGEEGTFSFAIDLWAVGAIAFRMITGRPAFSAPRQLFEYVVMGSQFPTEPSMSPECTKFVIQTMAASPRHRPSTKQALLSEWVKIQDTNTGAQILGSDPGANIRFIISTYFQK